MRIEVRQTSVSGIKDRYPILGKGNAAEGTVLYLQAVAWGVGEHPPDYHNSVERYEHGSIGTGIMVSHGCAQVSMADFCLCNPIH